MVLNKYKKINGISEHRLIMEKKIGRPLTKKEVVHHLNGDKKNNKIHNLMLFPNQKAHASFHSKITQFGYTNPMKKMIRERWDFLKTKII